MEAQVEVAGMKIRVAVASGLGNARKLLEEVRAGRKELHFIEVMTCPGGCINGGGQPLGVSPEGLRARLAGLYRIDTQESIRTSHNNSMVKRIYAEYLGEPLGATSHRLLHTRYAQRHVLV